MDKEEINNPYEVLQTFFENNDLRKCYDTLWQIIFGYVSSDFSGEGEEIANTLYFYERLEAVLEAAYILTLNKSN